MRRGGVNAAYYTKPQRRAKILTTTGRGLFSARPSVGPTSIFGLIVVSLRDVIRVTRDVVPCQSSGPISMLTNSKGEVEYAPRRKEKAPLEGCISVDLLSKSAPR